MKLVIDIPKDAYNYIKANGARIPYYKLTDAIKNGTPLPKGHGRLIDQDRMIARLEAASKYFSDENTDAFDERLSYGFKEAAIKVAGALTIIEADKTESEDKE